jgi:hypothetical protein
VHNSQDSHTHVLLNSIVVQRWAIASPPTQELLFGRPGGIVDKGHEYYNDWTHVIHRRASHCLLKARQPEVVSAVILQASFLPHILTFITDPLTPSIQSFSLSVMPQRSCVVIVESGAAIEFYSYRPYFTPSSLAYPETSVHRASDCISPAPPAPQAYISPCMCNCQSDIFSVGLAHAVPKFLVHIKPLSKKY